MFGTVDEQLRIRLHQFEVRQSRGAVLFRGLRLAMGRMHRRHLLHGLVLSIALASAAAAMGG